jgi:hypothetical protein
MERQSTYAPLCATFLLLAGQIAGCKSTEPPPTMVGGTGAPVAGTGAPVAGTSVPVSGTGAPKAGTSAPVSGIGASGTGVVSGTGGGMGGTGATSTPTCATANKTATPAALHAAAAAVLLPPPADPSMKGCAFTSCHDMGSHKAMLVLDGSMTDLNALLVGKPSCESSLKLVDASTGDAALTNSWLWQKLIAPCDTMGGITTQAAWGAPKTTCGQDMGQAFGQRMPRSGTNTLFGDTNPAKLNAVRDWICAGAPKP